MASTIRGSDNFDSAYGAALKAWVNFNGTGTVAIRGSLNVSSITDNGTSDYTVNFTNALADTNYAVIGAAMRNGTDGSGSNPGAFAIAGNTTYSSSVTASSVRIKAKVAATDEDCLAVMLAIFR